MNWYKVRFRDAQGDQCVATFKAKNIASLDTTLTWLGFSWWEIIG